MLNSWAMTDQERLAQLHKEVRAQWDKYGQAVAEGKPRVALIQIDRKLSRLEMERDLLELKVNDS